MIPLLPYLQYTGTGTGTPELDALVCTCVSWLLSCAELPPLAGRLHPYACMRPSSFFTWARTWDVRRKIRGKDAMNTKDSAHAFKNVAKVVLAINFLSLPPLVRDEN